MLYKGPKLYKDTRTQGSKKMAIGLHTVRVVWEVKTLTGHLKMRTFLQL